LVPSPRWLQNLVMPTFFPNLPHGRVRVYLSCILTNHVESRIANVSTKNLHVILNERQ
jgi:hypothetical protein